MKKLSDCFALIHNQFRKLSLDSTKNALVFMLSCRCNKIRNQECKAAFNMIDKVTDFPNLESMENPQEKWLNMRTVAQVSPMYF